MSDTAAKTHTPDDDLVAKFDSPLRTARKVAIFFGLLGAFFAILTPLLPVTQTTAQLNWPQNGSFNSVNAPLVAYQAIDLTLSIPCAAAAGLTEEKTVLLATVPKYAPDALDRGLLIQKSGETLEVVVRNTPVVTAPLDQVLSPRCQNLVFSATSEKVFAEFIGLSFGSESATPGAALYSERSGFDYRPQIVGVFTDLDDAELGTFASQELSFSATLDTRYSHSPTVIKALAIVLGILSTVLALFSLHILDSADGRKHRRFLPSHWWKFTRRDAVVGTILLWWHFVGANTSDDGYILAMARVSEKSGYLANYYRWYGTPEAPFGWYYDLLNLLSQISTASIWMRLPSLLLAILCWMLISREVIPRLGRAAITNPAVPWTAAAVFLAFWLPFNNGLRPEPIIAVGVLLTWCSIERAIATARLLPLAIGSIVAALTLFSGPSGLMAAAALLAGARPLLRIILLRAKTHGYLALLAPILAAGLLTTLLVFRDQTFMGVLDATQLKSAVGPNLNWFDEHVRYERLFTTSADGSVARRFAVLILILILLVSFAMLLRKGSIPGTASGPTRRILGITFMSFFALLLTPTKWTHHFGVFAGIAGALAALVAIVVSAKVMTSTRNRSLFLASALFLSALSFASFNSWWYVSNYGVPWGTVVPHAGLGLATILLGLALLMIIFAGWQHLRETLHPPQQNNSLIQTLVNKGRLSIFMAAPLTFIVWAVVALEVFSLTFATINQYPAYSVGLSNFKALGGDSCGLSNDVLAEDNSNSGQLVSLSSPAGSALGFSQHTGFNPNGVPEDIKAENLGDSLSAQSADLQNSSNRPFVKVPPGINGSTVRLPYGLDPTTTEILGSYQPNAQTSATLISDWYTLPTNRAHSPLLVVTAAGRFDQNEIQVEYSRNDGVVLGHVLLIDLGPTPSWRNLRVPLADLPTDATRVRLAVHDDDLAPKHWIAVTAPRVPQLVTLQKLVGSTDPVFLDWIAPLAFPCQRPFDHLNGVAEVPKWRILPAHESALGNTPVMDYLGGGPLGYTELLLESQTVPTYLKSDWYQDWGNLQILKPLDPYAKPAELTLGTATRPGLWSPAPLRH
ncbi:MAG: arabinosyltransferase domain-containing protein [Mycobacteriaceae bacterium]